MLNKLEKFYINPKNGVRYIPTGIKYWQQYLLRFCMSNLINFKNLPYTIPDWTIMQQLFTKGFAVIVKKNGKLYAPLESYVYLDTKNDVYYTPTNAGFANPALGSESKLKDYKNCSIIWASDYDKTIYSTTYPNPSLIYNQSLMWKTITRYASLLANLDSSMMSAIEMCRTTPSAQADDKATALAYNELIGKIRSGSADVVALNERMKFDGLKTLDLQPDFNSLPNFQALRDFLISNFCREIGMDGPISQEKKERLITDECNSENALLVHNQDLYYETIKEGITKTNAIFDTNIEIFKNRSLKI